MGWDGVGLDEMQRMCWDGLGWGGMGSDGMGWGRMERMESYGIGHVALRWGGGAGLWRGRDGWGRASQLPLDSLFGGR